MNELSHQRRAILDTVQLLLKQEAESTDEHEKVRLRHNSEALTEAVGSLASYELLQIKIKKMAEDL